MSNAPTTTTKPKKAKPAGSGRKRGFKYKRVDAFTFESRVDVVCWLLQECMPRPEISKTIAKVWDITQSQANDYLVKAELAFTTCRQRDREVEREKAIRRMESVYYKGLVRNDEWRCIEAQKVINAILGLEAGKKIELSGAIDGGTPPAVVAELSGRMDKLLGEFYSTAVKLGVTVPIPPSAVAGAAGNG